ncbi:MAG: protease inhibitor I42 family protein [Hyphomonas sp.]
MRLVLAVSSVLALGACGYFNKPAEDVNVAPPAEGETQVEPSEMPEMKMPTAEEARKAAEAAQAAAETGVVYAGEDQNGTTVAVPLGETLRIELVSIPTAGYVWTVIEAPAFMEVAGESTRATDPAHQEMAGFTGGNHFLSFDYVARAPGTGKFKLVEGRPWETEEAPMDTFEMTVTVTE